MNTAITFNTHPDSPTPRRVWRSRLALLLRDGIHEEQGQSLIELALTLTVLTAALLGAAEFGRLAYAAIEVSSAARAGVAYGSQNAVTAGDMSGMQAAAINDGSDISGWKNVGLSAVATEFCKCSNGAAINCAGGAVTCVSPSRVLVYVQVNTTATVNPLIYVPGLPTSFVLTGKAIMGVQQ